MTTIDDTHSPEQIEDVQSELDQRLVELTSLFEVTKTLDASLDLRTVLNHILLTAMGKMLVSKGWNSFMGTGKLIFRENAAIALALLDTPEAKDVLQEASKSRFKVLRKAYDRTKTITVSGGNTND